MNVRPLALVMLALPFVWSAALVVSDLSRADLVVVLVTFALVALVGSYSAVRAVYPELLVAATVGGLTAIALAAGFSSIAGWEVGAGLVLGLPWIWVGYVARSEAPLGLRFLAFGGAVTLGLLALAARAELGVPNGALGAPSFLRGVATALTDQAQVAGGLIGGTALPPLPLLDFFDPVYAALVAASVLGLCLASVRPQTGTGILLPMSIPLRRDESEQRGLPAAYGFSARQGVLFADRTAPEPPLTAWPPGLGAIVAGALGAGVFLLVAIEEPARAVLILTLALIATSLAVVVLTEFPGLLRIPVPGRRRRSRSLLLRAPTPRVTKELLTSPSLPVNEEPASSDA
jgi:hypothetical protein